MVETNRVAAEQLLQINKDFDFKNIQINNQTAQSYLQITEHKFDIVFIDPPFTDDLIQELTDLSIATVSNGGYVYRESAITQELMNLPDNWNLYRQKKAGQVKIELWQRMR